MTERNVHISYQDVILQYVVFFFIFVLNVTQDRLNCLMFCIMNNLIANDCNDCWCGFVILLGGQSGEAVCLASNLKPYIGSLALLYS